MSFCVTKDANRVGDWAKILIFAIVKRRKEIMSDMKRFVFFLTLAAVMVTLLSSCAVHPSGWKLVWKEDFKGKVIDERVWSRIGKGPSDWDDMMSLRPDLAYIEDGQLVLLGKENDKSGTDTTPFVTGGIWSSHKKSFRLARFDIRARFNNVQGFWPALWLMPDTVVPAPNYAEIDIMEHVNFETVAHQTVHSHYTLHINDENKPKQTVAAEFNVNEWNTYSTEIHPDSICFFINGKKTMTYPRIADKAYQFPWPDYPFYIILSNQLGGNWVGPVNAPEQLPSELRVDWIKVYTRH